MNSETLESRVARIAKQELALDDGTVPIEALVWPLLFGDDRIELCGRSGALSYKNTQKQLRTACSLLKTMIAESGATNG